MIIYLIVLVFLLLLSFRYDINGNTKNRDLWYKVMLVVFILIAGLRWRLGVDTPNYLGDFYHRYPTLEDFSFDDYGIAKSPFFVLINSIVKSFGGRFYVVQLIQATIVNVLVFKYIKRHSAYIFTCLFFYSFICYFTYNMETMRAGVSIVICLFANDFILDKKWLKGYLLYILALMFHPQTIVMFVLPLMFFMRFNKKGIIVLIMAFFVGRILSEVLQDYLFLFEGDDALERKATMYVDSEKYGEQGGNLNFYIAQIFFPIMFLLFSLLYIKKDNPNSKILKLEPFLMIGITFIIIRASLNIAYRFVDVYKLYFVLFYSELFVTLIVKAKKLDKAVAYARSFAILFPIIFFYLIYTYKDNQKGHRYIPYNSIFERSVNKDQQKKYNKVNSTNYPYIKRNEY